MVRITARVQAESIQRITDRLRENPKAVERGFRREFTVWGDAWQQGVRARFGSGGQLHNRTKMLSDSINYQVAGASLADLKLRCVSRGVNYAKQREYGGVIKAKDGGFLAIPTKANRQAANAEGPARSSAHAFIAAHPLGKETFFFRPNDAGQDLVLLMYKAPGKSKEAKSARRFALGGRAVRGQKGVSTAVAMFTLVREVDQPGPRSVKHPGPSKLGFHDEWNNGRNLHARSLQKIARGSVG